MPTNTKEKRISQRYSNDAMAKKRAKNCKRFLKQAKNKYGDKFDYSRVNFVTQKTPTTVGCQKHGWFQIVPDKHLRSLLGCPECGASKRAKNKMATHRKQFLERFNKRLGGRLKLVSEYQGAKSPITVECLSQGHRFDTIPDRLDHYYKEGCTICANKVRWQAQMKSEEEFLREVRDKFPDFDYSKSKYLGGMEPFTFDCPIHGEQTRRASDFLKSYHGCPDCGNEQTGYAGYRIRRLQSGDLSVKSRPTRIALMRMNIWGIETYKLGITTRTLEARYREAMETVYFEAVLDELDALMLELLLHQKYRNHKDNRVKFKGMRDGERWLGDEELYFKRAIKPMLSDLKHHVQELSHREPSYWDRFPELEIPSCKPRESTFTKGVKGLPRPVICLDTKKIYPSATEAARRVKTNQSSISSVCRGERKTTKGLRFAYLDD